MCRNSLNVSDVVQIACTAITILTTIALAYIFSPFLGNSYRVKLERVYDSFYEYVTVDFIEDSLNNKMGKFNQLQKDNITTIAKYGSDRTKSYLMILNDYIKRLNSGNGNHDKRMTYYEVSYRLFYFLESLRKDYLDNKISGVNIEFISKEFDKHLASVSEEKEVREMKLTKGEKQSIIDQIQSEYEEYNH